MIPVAIGIAAPKRHLHSIDQAAELLSISRPAIYRLCRDGKLPRVKIGSRSYIASEDLDRFVESLPRVEPL